MLEKVTIVIKTFERVESLNYLLSSIAKMNLPCPIIIADDSKTCYEDDIQVKYGQIIEKYITLPFDSGASKGRNVLVENVHTDYFLLCEDDFIFDKRTNLEFLYKHLENSDVELLAGMCYNRVYLIENRNHELINSLIGLKIRTMRHVLLWELFQYEKLRRIVSAFQKETAWDWYGYFKIENGICFISRLLDADYNPPFTKCDYVPNFFMAKTKALKEKNVFWDDEIRFQGEHLDFFFRAKRQSLIVAVTKEVGIIHQRIQKMYNRCGRDDRHIMMKKNSLSQIQKVDRI